MKKYSFTKKLIAFSFLFITVSLALIGAYILSSSYNNGYLSGDFQKIHPIQSILKNYTEQVHWLAHATYDLKEVEKNAPYSDDEIENQNIISDKIDALSYEYNDYNFYNYYLNNEVFINSTLQEKIKYVSDSLAAENTNLRYYITDTDKNIILTNVPNPPATLTSPEKISESMNSDFLRTDSYINKNNVLKYQIYIAIDSSLPISDTFESYFSDYSSFQKYLPILIISTIIFTIIALLLLCYILGTAGKVDDSNNIKLNWIDKIPTDIFIGLLFFAFIAIIILTELVINHKVLLAFMAFLAFSVLLISLTSFVKRVRSGTLFKNSIVAYAFKLIKILFLNLPIAIKALTILGSYALINSLLILFFVIDRSAIAFFFVLAFNIAVLIIGANLAIRYKKIENSILDIRNGNLQQNLNPRDLRPFTKMVYSINSIQKGLSNALEKQLSSERFKTELITNVSHDIKTPLTSIINYVDLLKKENLNNEKANDYLDILDSKAQRLKTLTEDLVEASKVSTGNITLNLETIHVQELIMQAVGEFQEQLENNNIHINLSIYENPLYIYADGRYTWRIIENIFSNIFKYSAQHSRVYIELFPSQLGVSITFKNISKDPLNITADALMERFVRGDKSRNTEGSGLGLSIAKNLTELQHGKFSIQIDGDLFKTFLIFPIVPPPVLESDDDEINYYETYYESDEENEEDNLNSESQD